MKATAMSMMSLGFFEPLFYRGLTNTVYQI